MLTKKNYNLRKTIRSQQDTAWKEILDVYFPNFVELCLPNLYPLINWQEPVTSLDKELNAITKGTKVGKKILDKLFKLKLKDNTEVCILIHIEVQGKKEDDFAKRMFTYGYRILDKYQLPLVSTAILTDNNESWRPNYYETEFFGSKFRADFLIIKLLDYKNKIHELENSNNPFSIVILVQLVGLETKHKSPEEKQDIKFKLTKKLYEKGLSKKEIFNLYIFIDWLIALPRKLELQYLQKIYDFEESQKMPYITSAEKFGMEQGIEQAKIEDAKNMIAEGLDLTMIARITKLPLEKIKQLQNLNN